MSIAEVRLLRFWNRIFKKKSPDVCDDNYANFNIDTNIKVNIKNITDTFKNCSDLNLREIKIGNEDSISAAVVNIDGLTDKATLFDGILKSIMLEAKFNNSLGKKLYDELKNSILPNSEVNELTSFQEVLTHILTGDTIIFINGINRALSCGTKGWSSRAVEEPNTEGAVRGPREGFTETLRVNTALIRRKIKTANLKMEAKTLGKYTRTDINIAYIDGIVDPDILNEVKSRLSRIEIDSILESGYIEELIEDAPYSPFPTVYHSEKPDKIAANLLEGCVAIITDGTPFVLTVPATYWNFMNASEDYYERYFIANFIRIMRLAGFFLSVLLPGLYIAVTTFHQEFLPTALLISIAGSRANVPFPALIEALLMEFTFEALREAGIRLPKQVGQAISIVGALVLGQAAVSASLVSPAMVIVVAITGISSFVIPSYNLAITGRVLRFIIMIFGSVMGLLGVFLGFLCILVHMESLRSFGIPYLYPITPAVIRDFKDTFLRAPWWYMSTRPTFLTENKKRMSTNLKPHTPKG